MGKYDCRNSRCEPSGKKVPSKLRTKKYSTPATEELRNRRSVGLSTSERHGCFSSARQTSALRKRSRALYVVLAWLCPSPPSPPLLIERVASRTELHTRTLDDSHRKRLAEDSDGHSKKAWAKRRRYCDCGHRRAKCLLSSGKAAMRESTRTANHPLCPCGFYASTASLSMRNPLLFMGPDRRPHTLKHAPDRSLKPRVKPPPQHAMPSDSNSRSCVGTILN